VIFARNKNAFSGIKKFTITPIDTNAEEIKIAFNRDF
jgi:hypothetical protein